MNSSILTEDEKLWLTSVEKEFAEKTHPHHQDRTPELFLKTKLYLNEKADSHGISDSLFGALIEKIETLKPGTQKDAWVRSVIVAMVEHEFFTADRYMKLGEIYHNALYWTLARNPSIPEALQVDMAGRDPLRNWAGGLCINVNLFEKAAHLLLDRDIGLASHIADNKNLSKSVVHRLESMNDHTINRVLLDSGSASPELMDQEQQLANELNSDSSKALLRKIEVNIKKDAENYSQELKNNLNQHKDNMTDGLLDALILRDTEKLITSENEVIDDDLFDLLLQKHLDNPELMSPWKYVLDAVASRKDLTPEQFKKLLTTDVYNHVSLTASENPSLPESMQQELAKQETWDSEVFGAGFLFQNPSLSLKSMKIMLKRNPEIASSIAQRENLPQEIIDYIVKKNDVFLNFLLISGGNMDTEFIDKTVSENPDKLNLFGEDICRLPQTSNKVLEIVIDNSTSEWLKLTAKRELNFRLTGNWILND